MTTLVFGAGFIGSAIHRYLLDRGWAARLLSAKTYRAQGVAAVLPPSGRFHVVTCAGVTRLVANDLHALRGNLDLVLGFVSLLPPERLESLTFLSSIDVYGNDIDGRRLSERMPTVPQDYYSLGKCMLESALMFYARGHGIRCLIPRLTGVYGAGDFGKSVIARLFASARHDGVVRVFAPGSDTRDYLHVADVARLIEAFQESRQSPGVLNAATGTSHRLLDIGQWVAECTGARLEIVRPVPASTARAAAISVATDYWKDCFPEIKPLELKEGLNKCAREYEDAVVRSKAGGVPSA